MKIILLSGGSGKRLWPLSNSVRSKQFLKLCLVLKRVDSQIQQISGLDTLSKLTFIEIQKGSLIEEDIERFAMP